ncbi:NAD-dependent epimerase/dehydratase family protein [Actinomadura sediminis]|uniref:NAD-dependent epimerase/dehydratase family protein n=1 Tax=Actinomadura sediminis TaxID=1038904 RepID=A0ABW3EYZ7_9ACTN
MAKVVVTGGNGFIGGHLVSRLAARGDDVTVFDPGPVPPDLAVPGVRYATGDIRDPDAVAAAIPLDVDVVYHMAAVVGVDRYLSTPLDVVDINVIGTRHVLDRAGRAGAKLVLASSSEVFGRNPAVPWSETADRVLGPTGTDRWVYSTSKAMAEHLVFGFAAAHGLPVTVVRYFNAYGPRQRPAFVVSRTIHRALRGLSPVVYDDGGQTRCFTYIEDLIDATVAAANDPKADGESFNVGSSVETPVRSVVELITELTGVPPTVVPVDTRERLGDRYQDLTRRVPDTAKAAEILGWEITTPLEEGVRRTIDWARDNPWWLALPDSGLS